MPYIEWNKENMKIRKNISLEASVFMAVWKIIRPRKKSFSGLISRLLLEWVETQKRNELNGQPV